jgi:hypothetical protein
MAATTTKADFGNAIPDLSGLSPGLPMMANPAPELYRFRRDDASLLRYPTA